MDNTWKELEALKAEVEKLKTEKEQRHLQVPQEEDALEKIVGDKANLEPIVWLEKAMQASKSVCRVVLSSGGLGTGFILEGGYLLTNNHVIKTRRQAQRAHIEFNYEKDANGLPKQVVQYELDATDFVTNQPLDFTRVKIQDPRGDLFHWGFLKINSTYAPELNEPVNIIQHPGGDYKQIALTANEVIGNNWQHYIFYNADTKPGSSGSPVFNKDWEVIAIHHAGKLLNADGTGGLQINAEGQRASANRGIFIKYILEFLQEKTTSDQHITPADAIVDSPEDLRPAPTPQAKNFFLMYDEGDRDQVVKLKKHLFLLERNKKLNLFDMHDFQVAKRSEAIQAELEKSDFVLACVTYNFFFSQYDLIEQASEMQKPIIVVLVNETDLEDSILDDLYYLPSNGKAIAAHPNEDAAYFDVVKQIRKVVKNS